MPATLRGNIINIIHKADQGLHACIFEARRAYYWPGVYRHIVKAVETCRICIQHSRYNEKQPITPHTIEELPWSKMGIDFQYSNHKEHLIIVDYHS